ncbi:DUF2513 domain-containing protein [Croceicoccus marinus]|nr:DUF2513 domain-containing protein [Croceicoccus marinus]
MDTVRSLLLAIAGRSSDQAKEPFNDERFSGDELDFYMPLLSERGLIKTEMFNPLGANNIWLSVRLTWDGHDFLDTIRDDEIWRQTKEGVQKAGGFSLDLLKALAKGLVKKKIETHTGVELDL